MKKGKTIRTSSNSNSQAYSIKTSVSSRKQQCRSVRNGFSINYAQSLDAGIRLKYLAKKMRTRVRVDGERETKISHKATTDSISGVTTGHSQNFRSTRHLITNTRHRRHIVLPVPSCLEGFWAALSFEADWLSAQPMSSLRLCTSLYTSTRWVE